MTLIACLLTPALSPVRKLVYPKSLELPCVAGIDIAVFDKDLPDSNSFRLTLVLQEQLDRCLLLVVRQQEQSRGGGPEGLQMPDARCSGTSLSASSCKEMVSRKGAEWEC